jgi:hypothetical protein
MMQSFARGMVRRTELRDDARRMDYAFQSAVARKPRSAERALLLQVLEEQRKRFSEDVASARKLVGKEDQAAQDVVELAAWFHVANILLNLDETITKG